MKLERAAGNDASGIPLEYQEYLLERNTWSIFWNTNAKHPSG